MILRIVVKLGEEYIELKYVTIKVCKLVGDH